MEKGHTGTAAKEASAPKGSLSLVGIGISDEKGISLAGLEELKGCDKIFAELYTNAVPEGTLERLEELVGKKIEILSREEVEGEEKILEAASSSRVALVTSGDPMIATTHVSLFLAAKRKGIPVRVIHATSILSAAIGESGLQAYKFGKTVTLAYWRENYRPMTTYDVIAENLGRGLHTLVLLDIDEHLGPMKPQQAAKLMLEMEKTGKKGILLESTKVVLLSALSTKVSRKTCGSRCYSPLAALAEGSARPAPAPAVLIVPSRLHFLESEYLESL